MKLFRARRWMLTISEGYRTGDGKYFNGVINNRKYGLITEFSSGIFPEDDVPPKETSSQSNSYRNRLYISPRGEVATEMRSQQLDPLIASDHASENHNKIAYQAQALPFAINPFVSFTFLTSAITPQNNTIHHFNDIGTSPNSQPLVLCTRS